MDILALIVIVFLASAVQSGTGFGFSILATPFLLVFLGPHDAIQLNILLSFLISLLMALKTHKDVHKEILWRLIKGSLTGILPGLLLFIVLDVRPLKILVGTIILIATGLLLLKIRIKPSRSKEFISGSLSGLLTTSIGVPGPPLLIYFAGANVDKAILRSTTLAYFVFIYLAGFLLQFLMYGISEVVLTSSLWAIPFTLFGIFLGQWLFKQLNQQLFLKIIYVLLFSAGIYLLFSVL